MQQKNINKPTFKSGQKKKRMSSSQKNLMTIKLRGKMVSLIKAGAAVLMEETDFRLTFPGGMTA